MLKIDERSNLKRQLDSMSKWTDPVSADSSFNSRRLSGFSRRADGMESMDQRMIERSVAQALIKNKQIVLNIIGENYRSAGNLNGRW